MDRVSVAEDEKILEMEGSDAATGLTHKIVCFMLDVLDSVSQVGNYCLQKEAWRVWDPEKELKQGRVGVLLGLQFTQQTTSLSEASSEPISAWLSRIRVMGSKG